MVDACDGYLAELNFEYMEQFEVLSFANLYYDDPRKKITSNEVQAKY